MGVFGEKHTSLTREQKRQLIHQADTHKLRPTEVCDWVQATWGLRIARVTVYSILHKQRASLMAGHKDFYQTMQSSLGLTSSTATGAGAIDGASAGFTNTIALAQDACLLHSKDGQRVNKYRVSPNKNKNKEVATTTTAAPSKSATAASSQKADGSTTTTSKGKSKRTRSTSVVSDRSSEGTPGEVGTRWEGQLKRVREPASVELDQAMVAFLKSPASVDSQGRRLNDAELQSHALRLAQSIPSASRMRCSFGWLRHFKRRLGVQWAADRLGQYRWTVEIGGRSVSSSTQSSTNSTPSPTESQVKVKMEQDQTERVRYQAGNGNDDNEEDVEEEYHSTHEFSPTAPSPKKRSRRNETTDAGQSFAAAMLSTSTMMRQTQYDDSSILSIQPTASLLQDQNQLYRQQHQHQPQHQSPQAIMDAYPNMFGCVPALQIPGIMSTISPMATTLDPTNLPSSTSTSGPVPAAFGMSVDGKMRKVPSKEEAYDMLQSLLMYYEQDHSYIGEQQTLLLPRWIHQQRQIMHQTQETEARMMWMRQQQQQQQQQQQMQHHVQPHLFGSSFPLFDSQSLLEHGQLQQQFQQNQLFFQQHHQKMHQQQQQPQQSYPRYHSSFSSTSSDSSSSSTSPSSLSPISPTLSSPPPMPALNRLDEFLAGTGTTSTLEPAEDELEETQALSFSAVGLWPLTA